jgi:hypothetical protein
MRQNIELHGKGHDPDILTLERQRSPVSIECSSAKLSSADWSEV